MSDWRIDELAQRAGVAVDTIRYYQREGLLPSGERSGRTPPLRPRAPRAPRAHPRPPVPPLLAGGDPRAPRPRRPRCARRRCSPVPRRPPTTTTSSSTRPASTPSSCATSTDAGLLRDPAEHGRSARTTPTTSNVLRAFADLGRARHPRPRCSSRWPASTRPGSTRSSASWSRCSPCVDGPALGRRGTPSASARCSRTEVGALRARRAGDRRLHAAAQPAARRAPRRSSEHGTADGRRLS